ncbi:hypothetical protein RND81_05G271600 [Saponaria officinalis]|uniref:CCT domain-containing protein n=1 Tax=Saponaria officinalis TaxID=3572 RepID=A0AAW1L1U7_SAPOF
MKKSPYNFLIYKSPKPHKFSHSTHSELSILLLFPKSTTLTDTMYNHNYNVNDQNSSYFGQFDPSNLSTLFTQSLTCDLESVQEPFMLENGNGSTSTGSSYMGSPSSPLSCTSSHPPHFTKTLFQRSLSSHSLDQNEAHPLFSNPPTGISSLDLGSVRRVSSTGDLEQGMLRHHNPHRGSPLANETTSIIIEGMTKPCRYSPDEKKERIEKYRNKRTQRNFNKKIQVGLTFATFKDSKPKRFFPLNEYSANHGLD